ncbi:hypothetical protein [Actinoplanes sp. NPDC051411]|uniref:hypothetical protein n=1 Tax=Actinoplanes sp. NPDC051411 TaxID=3155522 RepID=UPI0034155438
MDESRDIRGWLVTPLVTLLVAPALAVSVGILVAASSTSTTAEHTADSTLVLHARIFAAGWLLLWALPWWRGLRDIRIGAAAVIGAVLVAGPLRLIDANLVFEEHSPDIPAYILVVIVLIGVPIVGFVLSAIKRHFLLAGAFVIIALVMGLPIYALAARHAGGEHRDPAGSAGPVCVMHSGSHDVCPGG